MVQSTTNRTLNVLINGKLVGVFCYEEGDPGLEQKLIDFAEPSLDDANIFQLVIVEEEGYADFLSGANV